MLNMLKKNKKGFTLIELIIVIAIIAILAAVLLPRFMGFTDSANSNSVRADAKNIATSIEAMIAEGKAISDAAVITYLGRSPGGMLTTAASGDSIYIKQLPTGTGSFYLISYTQSTSKFSATVNKSTTFALADYTILASITKPGGYVPN